RSQCLLPHPRTRCSSKSSTRSSASSPSLTTLFRSVRLAKMVVHAGFETDQRTGMILEKLAQSLLYTTEDMREGTAAFLEKRKPRSEEHTSELQSRENLVCRLLLEKTKNGSAA